MIELLIAVIAGAVANRAGARWVRSLPDTSMFKGPGVVIFGGPGPWRPPQ